MDDYYRANGIQPKKWKRRHTELDEIVERLKQVEKEKKRKKVSKDND